MKKLLNTLYVLSQDSYLTLDGENAVINKADGTQSRFPLHLLENIVTFTYKGASPALMGACMQRDTGLSMYSPNGKFLASVNGPCFGNVLLRKEQYRISDDDEKAVAYARNMITAKVYNCRRCLERAVRDHSLRIDSEKIKAASILMRDSIEYVYNCSDKDVLRGLEGKNAVYYFSVFDELILNQKEDFKFTVRNKRPPTDRVNALLSFAYTILAGECSSALSGVGLDPYVGFMHSDRPGRKSLALDIMEEMRPVMADRFVLKLINMRIIQPNMFDTQNSGAVFLNDSGRKAFFNAWQTKKREVITHPYINEKIPWGLVPHIQAQLLARTIRKDLNQYPPFMWK